MRIYNNCQLQPSSNAESNVKALGEENQNQSLRCSSSENIHLLRCV